MQLIRPSLCALVLSAVLPALVSAQEPAKVVRPYRLGPGDEPPTLDGRLDDPIWQKAPAADDFHQIEPVDHGTPTQETRVYLAYDEDFLYIGADLRDREPEKIRDTQMIQGSFFFSDDRFVVLLDTFDDDRNSYYFMTNPNGMRRDALFGSDYFVEDWQGIWYVEAGVNDKGWVAELAIPFKTLSFDPGHDTWGINFWRGITRTDEAIAWASRNREFTPATCGSAEGLTGMDQGLGLDVVPSLTWRSREGGQGGDQRLEPSLDLFYKLTPLMTLSLTLNTDFSATEVDDRQINRTRFDLFFPEKREFFLQDAGIFSFGRLASNGLPFFSRRIGLSEDGQPIDLTGGVKLTGRTGRLSLGLLGVRQQAFGELGEKDLFVGRVIANVLAESTLGFIATSGNPTSDEDNSVGGVDFLYRNTRFRGGRTVEAGAWYQRSNSEHPTGGEAAFGVELGYPNDRVSWSLGAVEIQDGFNPALGFVNRAGIRQYTGAFGYRHRPQGSWLRAVDNRVDFERTNDLEGNLETERTTFTLFRLSDQTGDSLGFFYSPDKDLLTEPFEISPGVVIPAGRYEYADYGVTFATGKHRPLRVEGSVSNGEFFNGESWIIDLLTEWRPSRYFFSSLRIEVADIDLPAGSFTTRLAQMRANVAFNPRWAWLSFVQYDNVSETVGLDSRLRWIPLAGREAQLVFTRGWEVDNGARVDVPVPVQTRSDLVFKANYTFRF